MNYFFLILSIISGVGYISAMDTHKQKTVQDYEGQLYVNGNTINLAGKGLVSLDGITTSKFKNEHGQYVLLKDVPNLHLNVSKNLLSDLPIELQGCANIVELNLSLNKFSICPEALNDMRALRTIDFSCNQLTEMPLLKQLHVLRLINNNIEQLPISIPVEMQLRNLQLSKNNIAHIPDSFSSLIHLKELHAPNNPIKTISDKLCDLIYLEHLALHFCQMEEFPLVVTKMPSLRTLYLSNNPITILPDECKNAHQWISFAINGFDVQREHLYSDETRARKLIKTHIDGPKKALNAKLKTWCPSMLVVLPSDNKEYNVLNLSHAGLDDISGIDTLTVLHITYDDQYNITREEKLITEVPDLCINLSHNKLRVLPDEIGNLDKLVGLIMNEAEIKDVPSIDQLTRLETLSLEKNQLESIPTGVFALDSLVNLRLADNQLKEINPRIDALSQLAQLDVSKNQLSTICSLAILTRLQHLDVSNNTQLCANSDECVDKAYELYNNLNQLRDLKYLNLKDIGISEKGTQALPQSIAPMTRLVSLRLSPVPFETGREVQNVLKRNISLVDLA